MLSEVEFMLGVSKTGVCKAVKTCKGVSESLLTTNEIHHKMKACILLCVYYSAPPSVDSIWGQNIKFLFFLNYYEVFILHLYFVALAQQKCFTLNKEKFIRVPKDYMELFK